MENIGIAKMGEELAMLNPKVRFDVRDTAVSPVNIIYADVPGESLKLPEGYFYDGRRNSISNKGNTKSGRYEYFTYECDAAHFNRKEQPKTKRSLFARLFAK